MVSVKTTTVKHKTAKKTVKKKRMSMTPGSLKFEKDLNDLSDRELKEMILISMYKMALMRAQLEAVTKILIKHKLTDYEEMWKDTNDNFKNSI